MIFHKKETEKIELVTRPGARQADEDYEEGLSDEEMDLVKNIAKEFDDDQILDGEQSGLTTRTPSPTLATKYVHFETPNRNGRQLSPDSLHLIDK